MTIMIKPCVTENLVRYALVFFTLAVFGCSADESITEDLEPPPPPPPEPVVSILSPQAGAVVDTAVITIEATDDKGVVLVEVFIDNLIPTGGTFVVPPYSYEWDLETLPDSSSHLLYAKAYDADGNVSSSDVIQVTTFRLRPSGVTAQLVGWSVLLKWEDQSAVETGYEVEMSVDGSGYSLVATAPRDTTQATVSSLPRGPASLSFRVSAVKDTIRSRYVAPIDVVLPTVDFTGVSLSDQMTARAVGGYGIILNTFDGGNNWVVQSSGTPSALLAVDFADASTGWAVGISTIVHTADGGNTWEVQLGKITSQLEDVFFLDSFVGWAVRTGGTILHTINGGMTWNDQVSGVPSNNFQSVAFADANTGIVVGTSGTILHTIDGGTTWMSRTSGTTQPLTGVTFSDANTAIAVGYDGIILRTRDRGHTWLSQRPGTDERLLGVSFVPGEPDFGTCVGYVGTILHTTDGGSTWVSQASGTASSLNSVSFIDINTGTVVGEEGIILRTTDGGLTWVSQ